MVADCPDNHGNTGDAAWDVLLTKTPHGLGYSPGHLSARVPTRSTTQATKKVGLNGL